jgi:hypothetical protein
MAGNNMVYKLGVVIGILLTIGVLKWLEISSVNRRKAKKWQRKNPRV